MTFSKSTLLKLFLSLLPLVFAGMILSRCGGKDSGSTSGFTYSYSGNFEASGTSLALEGDAVHFTLSWSETDGKIDGTYQDDYFANTTAAVSGEVKDGRRTLVVTFAQATNGISQLVFVTPQISGELTESISLDTVSGLAEGGTLVFEKSGITMTKGSGGGTTPATDANSFFASVAGEYDYYAKNTNAIDNGTLWTHGNKYKIVIDSLGKLTIPTDGEEKTFTHGSTTGDSFEKYDHEEFAIYIVDDKTKIIVQHQFDPENFFITYQIQDGAFWQFAKEDPGALPTVLGNRGIGYAVGTFKHKITFISGENATDYAMGDAVEITIGEDGNVTGTFGEFKFVADETSIGTGTSNGKAQGNISYYRPDSKTFPRWTLQMRFEEEKWTGATATYETQLTGNTGRKAYNAVVSQ